MVRTGRVVLLVGCAGSGKSAVLAYCAGKLGLGIHSASWDPGLAVVSQFPRTRSFEHEAGPHAAATAETGAGGASTTAGAAATGSGDSVSTPRGEGAESASADLGADVSESAAAAAKFLACSGLSSIPSWCKPHHILSTGEKYRANVARALAAACCRDDAAVVVDDFTSYLDRQTAAAAANNLGRQLRKLALGALLAGCCADVSVWLQPHVIGVLSPSGTLRLLVNNSAGTPNARPRVGLRIRRADLLRIAHNKKTPFPHEALWSDASPAVAGASGIRSSDAPASEAGCPRRPPDHNNRPGTNGDASVCAGACDEQGAQDEKCNCKGKGKGKGKGTGKGTGKADASSVTAPGPCCLRGARIKAQESYRETLPFEFQHEREPPPPGGTVLCTTVARDDCTRMCDALFDNEFDGRCLFRVPRFPSPSELGPFTLGLVRGPSGTAKSVLATLHFGLPTAVEWAPGVPVGAHFTASPWGPQRLCAVGLDTPRHARALRTRSFDQFSRTEQALLNVARMLGTPNVVFDEFTSGMDRPAARRVAAGVTSFLRTHGTPTSRVVLVACYDDLVACDGLMPDWVFDTAAKSLTRFDGTRCPCGAAAPTPATLAGHSRILSAPSPVSRAPCNSSTSRAGAGAGAGAGTGAGADAGAPDGVNSIAPPHPTHTSVPPRSRVTPSRWASVRREVAKQGSYRRLAHLVDKETESPGKGGGSVAAAARMMFARMWRTVRVNRGKKAPSLQSVAPL